LVSGFPTTSWPTKLEGNLDLAASAMQHDADLLRTVVHQYDLDRFWLWRIDAARERLEREIKELTDPELTHAQIQAFPGGHPLTGPNTCAAAQSIRDQLLRLRALSAPSQLDRHSDGR
jgi:hypothetical protein